MEDKNKLRSIAQRMVWYTSVNWKKYKRHKKRTSFEELPKDEKGYFLLHAQICLDYCTKWEFNPVVPYITNTVVYPAHLFKEREDRYVRRRQNY